MEIFKTKCSFLVLFLLVLHCTSPYTGEALSPTEATTTKQVPAGASLEGENTPLLATPPFSTPAINKNTPFGPSLNNQGQQAQTIYQQQQQFPQQSLPQPFSGLTQPFSSVNQPFLGVNQQYSPFNQPFTASNQQGLATDNTAFDNGASGEKRVSVGAALISLTALMATLGFIV